MTTRAGELQTESPPGNTTQVTPPTELLVVLTFTAAEAGELQMEMPLTPIVQEAPAEELPGVPPTLGGV